MADIRIIKHEAVPKCGSFEVRFSDGRPLQYFYWEDLPGGPAEAGSGDERGGSRAGQSRCTGERGTKL
jgi:hypothetical protein